MRFSDGVSEKAAVDPIAAFAVVSEDLCKQHNQPIDRTQTRSSIFLGDGGAESTVGSDVLILKVCQERIHPERGVVPRSDWPFLLYSHLLHSRQMDVLYTQKELRGRMGASPLMFARNFEGAGSHIMAFGLSSPTFNAPNLFKFVPPSTEQTK